MLQLPAMTLPSTAHVQEVCGFVTNVRRFLSLQLLVCLGSAGAHLWKPAGEVVHYDSCNKRFAKTSGQTDQCVLQQRSLDDVHLVCPFIHCSWVHPVLGIAPASSTVDCKL